MPSPESHPAHKIATIGLASTVITASMTGVSVAQENENLSLDTPTASLAATPAQPVAPSETEIEQARQALREAEETRRHQETQLAAKEETQAQAMEDLLTLESQHRQAENDRQRLTELTGEELQLNQEANQRAVEQAQQSQHDADNTAQRLNTELQAEERRLDAATSHRDEAHKNLRQAQDAYDSKLDEAGISTNPQGTQLRPTTHELETRLKAATAQRDELTQQIGKAQKDKERLTSEQTVAQANLAEKQGDLTRLDNELADARRRVTETEDARIQAQNKADSAREKLAELMSSQEPSSSLEDKTRELRDLEKQIEQAEKELVTYEETLDELHRQIQETQTLEQTLSQTLDTLDKQLQQTQLRVNDLSIQISAHEEELAELDVVVRNLTAELDEVRKKIAVEENKDGEAGFTREELVNPLGSATDLALYRSNNGVLTRVTELSEPPADLSNYVLKARGTNGRSITLDVHRITFETRNGSNIFRATAVSPDSSISATAASVDVRVKPAVEAGVYTTFASLVDALKSGATTVRMGADMYADEVALGDKEHAYISQTFSGTFDGAGYSLHGLIKPLFSSLGTGARVQSLTLKDVQINDSETNVAALARQAENATIAHVHVSGKIRGGVNVAGLIAHTTSVNIQDSTVAASIDATHTHTRSNTGGVVAFAQGGRLQRVAYKGNMSVSFADSTANRVGGLVGNLAKNAQVEVAYAEGKIHNPQGYGQVGGLVGSTWSDDGKHGGMRRSTSAMKVDQGHIVHGDRGFNANLRDIRTVVGQAAGHTDNNIDSTDDTAENADAFYTRLLLRNGTVNAPNLRAQEIQPEYTALGARTDRYQAYRNYAKLLPYASQDTIVRAANKLADADPLVTKELRSVLPTVKGKISTDTVADADHIDGLLLHFGDKTIDRRSLIRDTREGTQSKLAHYYMAAGLPYTPQQVTGVDKALVARLAEELKSISFESIPATATISQEEWDRKVESFHKNAVTEAAKKGEAEPSRESSAAKALDEHQGLLYLRETFTKQHDLLEEQLTKLIARESALPDTGFTQREIEKKISENKEALLLGLAYVNKWYNVAFDTNNLQDFFVFRHDFYGVETTPLDTLIQLGKSYALLNPRHNLTTYNKLFAPYTQQRDLADALDDLRRQFTQYTTFDDWFKATTKVHLVETKSLAAPEINVHLSKRLREVQQFKSHLLPILTVSDDSAFITVHITSIGFGTFDRYIDKKKVTPSQRPEVIARLKEDLKVYSKKYRDYYDMWYRIGNETMRRHLNNTIPVWDGFSKSKQYGPEAFRAIEELYGPTGRWFKGYGALGFSFRVGTFMEDASMLGGDGSIVTYTHEMVHNMERFIFLGGEGMRPNSSFEVYPNDLLQNPWNIGSDGWAFNQSTYFTDQGKTYLHNTHPNRFQTLTDLNQYYKGYFDALYMLDNAEAEVILERNADEHARLLMRLGNHPIEGKRHLNSYDKLSADQIRAMNLRSIDDLIDHEIMIRRGQGQTGVLGANGYWSVPILEPMYGTGESDLGITGESAFKRNAFELLAARGYHEGFVAYTSDKFAKEAQAAGMPNLPDTFIMPRIFEGQFQSLKEYRKHAYASNRDRARSHLRSISLRFENQDLTFSTYDEIVDYFRTLLTDDYNRQRENNRRHSRVYAFKAALFSALMRQTQEFRTSIFDDGDDSLVPWTPPAPEVEEALYAPVMAEKPELDASSELFTHAVLPTPPDTELVKSLRERERELNDRIVTLSRDIEGLGDARQQMTADREHETATLRDLKQRHEAAREEYAQKRSLQERLSTQRSQTQALHDDAASRKRKNEERQRVLEAELAQMNEKITAARSALLAAQEELRLRSQEHQRASDQASQHEALADEAREAVRVHREEVNTVATKLEELAHSLLSLHSAYSDRDTEISQLLSLRSLSRAVDAARLLVAEEDNQVRDLSDRVQRSRMTVQDAAAKLSQAQDTLVSAKERQKALASATVSALLRDPNPAAPYGILSDLLNRLRQATNQAAVAMERMNTLKTQIDDRAKAIQTCREHLAQARLNVATAREKVERLERLKRESEMHNTHAWKIPDSAPTVEPLPEYEIPRDWLPRVPGSAPTMEPLPEFKIPRSWLKNSATAQESSSDRSSGNVSMDSHMLKLADTGGDLLSLLGLSTAGVLAGAILMKRRRQDSSES